MSKYTGKDILIVLVEFAVIAGLVVWLHRAFGWWASGLAVFVLASLLAGLVSYARDREVARKSLTDSNGSTTNGIPGDDDFKGRGWQLGDWFNHEVLRDALAGRPDWDNARFTLQKVSYEITRNGIPQSQKDWFKGQMTRFARRDPLYVDVIGRVKNALTEQPGMIQSDIYKGRSEKEKEGARYILYFAAELGDIERVKSGRSYRLYLPGKSQESQ